MASLPSQHPTLSLHLTDTALTPLITSARSQQQLEGLTTLTSAALTSRAALARLGLGTPQRLMVEHASGPVALHSFLSPSTVAADNEGKPREGSDVRADGHESGADAESEAGSSAPPMLIGLVVAAAADDAREARRAAGRLERVGKEFQREWAAEELAEDAGDATE